MGERYGEECNALVAAGTAGTGAGFARSAASRSRAHSGPRSGPPSLAKPKFGFEGKLDTKPDGAFFWSGPSPAADGTVSSDVTMNKARDYAVAAGGDTMETVMKRNGVVMPKYGSGTTKDEIDASIKAWGDASAEYARNAKGSVKAVIGNARPNGVWYTIELPTLLNNPKITKITQIDAATGKESLIFDRAKGILNKPAPLVWPKRRLLSLHSVH